MPSMVDNYKINFSFTVIGRMHDLTYHSAGVYTTKIKIMSCATKVSNYSNGNINLTSLCNIDFLMSVY